MKKLGILLLFLQLTCLCCAQSIESLKTELDTAWAQGDIARAKALIVKIMPQAEKKLGNDPKTYSSLLNTIGSVYYQSGEMGQALDHFEKAVQQASKLADNPNYSLALYSYNLAMALMETGRYTESEKWFLSSLPVLADGYGAGSLQYTKCFYSLALLYTEMGKYKEAESMNGAAVNYFKVDPGQQSDEYLNALNNMGRIYQGMGNYSEAERFFVALADYYRQLPDVKPEALSGTLNNLGELYRVMGDHEKAEPLFIESLNVSKSRQKNEPLASASALNNLALLYKATGRYAEAEKSFKESLKLYEAAGKKDHPDYTNPLNNLGELYRTMGRYQEAANAFLEVLDIRKRLLSEENVSYANALNNLGLVYLELGGINEAEPLLLKCKEIYAKLLGEKHIYYANSLQNLASVYASQEKYDKAIELKLRSLEIFREALGENNIKYAQYLNGAAIVYFRVKKYDDAIRLLEQAETILKGKVSEDHYDHVDVMYNLAELYSVTGKGEKADEFYLRAMKGYRQLIKNYFPALSEEEKTQFYYHLVNRFETFNSYVVDKTTKGRSSDTLISSMFDLQLATKGLLLSESGRLYPAVMASKDNNLIALYEKWIAKKKLLSEQYRLSPEELLAMEIDVVRTEKEANDLERELQERTGTTQSSARSWREIRDALLPGEAAVEMVRVQYYDGSRFTDTATYAALILTKSSSKPQIVIIPKGEQLEEKYLSEYHDHIRKKEEDQNSYAAFWAPLQKSLKDVKSVYFAADGAYHQLNLYSLYNTESKKYLAEEISITLLTNTYELSKRHSKPKPGELVAELFGDPDYNSEVQGTSNKGVSRFGIDYLPELPGTKVEVDTIAEILRSHQWKVHRYTRMEASEEALKNIKRPGLLHVATHGYFLKNVDAFEDDSKILGIEATKAKENPLLRSGLMFAGAATNGSDSLTLKGKEDGILTAYEAATLDLSNTKLVVLSACETGLGEVRNGQGVYGLQRAFLVAGAEALIMSLWIVDDFATQELMTEFYSQWSSDPKGDKQKAFRAAQLKLKEKYPSPYYWAAFVMIGN
jgi:CHAT domain-containing protein/lipopolysaccharide biosynthesis regulator YciM